MNSFKNIVTLSNDFCNVLIDMERHGMPVSIEALEKLENTTILRIAELDCQLHLLAESVCGDTPFSLTSDSDLIQVLFSRRIKDKQGWKDFFGFHANMNKFEVIGLQRQLSDAKFIRGIQLYTEVTYRTEKEICPTCIGSGKVSREGKGKRKYNCTTCNKVGIYYRPTEKISGLKITPKKEYLLATGLSTSDSTIEHIMTNKKLPAKAQQFLTMYNEYRKLSSYLATGILGIKNNLINGVLHPNFHQTSTSTGRLSSTNPNVQNFPKGNVFPLKQVFVSRWAGGLICDGDMGQLEFRCAVHQAGDELGVQDIVAGVDIHRVSASKIFNVPEDKVTKEQRQEAKAETFAPLYGASRDWGLLERYKGIKDWHTRLINEAVKTKEIHLETGRFYKFPGTRRTAYGCTNQTKIKNYPVQGFASADVVPSIIVELYKRLKEGNYKSYIMSTIHDSVLVDVHPYEKDEVLKLIYLTLNDGVSIIKKRFGIDLIVPLKADVKVGVNALDTEEYKV